MSTCYLKVAAVNLDHFIYDTHDISTIRGGSYLLLDAIKNLITTDKLDKFKLREITSSSSAGLFQVSEKIDSNAARDKLVKQLLTELHDFTKHHATFVAAYQVVEDENEKFQVTLQKLEAKIRKKQLRFPTVAIPNLDVNTSTECYLNGWQPGTVSHTPDAQGQPTFISKSTDYRRNTGRKIKHNLFEKRLGDDLPEDFLSTKDLGLLAKNPSKGMLDGRIAYIEVDGNAFGKNRYELCEAPEDLSEFDVAIQEEFRNEFLSQLLEKANSDPEWKTKDAKNNDAFRLEVLVWGGDEMMLVVPAWKGWEVIELFFECAQTLNFKDSPLSHRAAITFCPHNTPILRLRELSGALLNKTKESTTTRLKLEGYEDKDPVLLEQFNNHERCDALHFLNLTTFDMLEGSLDAFLAKYYKNLSYDRLLLRASELAGIKSRLKILRKTIARSKVYAVIDLLQQDLSEPADQSEENSAGRLASEEERQARIKEITDQALKILPANDRRQTANALPGDPEESEIWYLLSDLWDYLLKWD